METWNKFKDIAIVLLIPAVGWVMTTQSDSAVRNVRLKALEAQMEANTESIQLLRETDNRFEIHFARIEGRLDRVESRLEEVMHLLRQHNQAHGVMSFTSNGGGGGHTP